MKLALVLAMSLLSGVVMAKDIEMKISGMVCSMCAQGIQKKFSTLNEVKDLKVNMDSKMVSIVTKDDLDIPDETLKKLIQEAGYNVTSIERK